MSKHVQHEDLNRKQKERVLSIFLKFCIILILLGGAIGKNIKQNVYILINSPIYLI